MKPLTEPHRGAGRGFTLLEVIVALAIVSIGILALSRAMSGYISSMAASEQYVAAGWVAANQLESLRIARTEPVVGSSSGSEQMAGRQWHYQVVTESTADPDLFRVDVSVYSSPEDELPVSSRFGYLRRPEQPDA